jgi:hypothetical protein
MTIGESNVMNPMGFITKKIINAIKSKGKSPSTKQST